MRDAAPKPPDDRSSGPRGRRSPADRDLAERLLSDAKAGRDLRTPKVRRVRAAIEARSYENELKLAVALERLQDQVREEAALLAELCDPEERRGGSGAAPAANQQPE
jgi:hypothetical protein